MYDLGLAKILIMFKAGFEVVHGGSIDIMQPPHHDQWDYPNVNAAFPDPLHSAHPHSKPIIDSINHRYIHNNHHDKDKHELPRWIEHVTKQLIAEPGFQIQTTSSMAYENNNIVPAILSDMRPRKSARRSSDENAGHDIHHHPHRFYSSATDLDLGDDHQETNNLTNETKGADRGGDQDQNLTLMTLLMECAVAISVDNIGEAHRMLLELTQMATPYGPSCAERIVAYFAKAMASRVVNSWLGICSPLISHQTLHGAFQAFNNVAPFVKFAHFTPNQSILEAFHCRDRVHIIDVDVMQGLQWPALFYTLATRMEGPPRLRMTGMGTSLDVLMDTGRNLSNFAKRLGMSFEFHPIARKFGEIDASALQIPRGETIAVHWLQHSMYDATGPDWKTMRLLQEISPRVITLVEQEIAHGGSFLDRFVGALHYYSNVFDSLGMYMQGDDPTRHRVEHDLLYKEINNILAIGGPARSGEDKYRHWRTELLKNGFVQVGMSTNSMAQAQLILNMFPPSHCYSLVQGDGTLRLGWKDTSLYSVSAWTSPNPR